MSLIDEAISALGANSINEPRIDSAPTPSEISSAEKQLGVKFPPSFLRFLSECGAYQLPFWETYWVGACKREDIVKVDLEERNRASLPLPAYLIAFFNNGAGDQLCFDTRKVDKNEEYPVVFWDHELSLEDNLSQLEPIAATFSEWLLDEVRESSV